MDATVSTHSCSVGSATCGTCRARASWVAPACCRLHPSRWWCAKQVACICFRRGTRGSAGDRPRRPVRPELESCQPRDVARVHRRIAAGAAVGTDGLTPMFAGLLPQLVTTAELVDAAPVMAAARRIKTPDEITCLDVASAIAEAALSAMDDALDARHHRARTARRLLRAGGEPRLADGAVGERRASQRRRSGPVRFRHLASDRPIGDGELVVLAPERAVRRIRGRPGPHPGGRKCGAEGAVDRRRDAPGAWTH